MARGYDWPSFRPTEKTTVPVARALPAPLTGRYELRSGKVLVVTAEGDSLFIIEGLQPTELFPQLPTKFFELGLAPRSLVPRPASVIWTADEATMRRYRGPERIGWQNLRNLPTGE